MKKLAFVVLGSAALSLAGCGSGNQDAVENVEMNQPAAELNGLANDAAIDANAEAAALGTQQQQLEQENAVDNATSPTDEQEQNVEGM